MFRRKLLKISEHQRLLAVVGLWQITLNAQRLTSDKNSCSFRVVYGGAEKLREYYFHKT